VHLLDRYLMARRDQRTGCLSRACQLLSRYCILISGRLYGNYLTCCYVLVKLLYCVNAIGQLFLLDVFLGYDYHVLGVHVIRHLLFGEKWIPSERPVIHVKLECGADAKRDGRPAEYRWRLLRKFRNSIPCTIPQTLADACC